MVKGQSRPRTPGGGNESCCGTNPGVGGSNPLVDAILHVGGPVHRDCLRLAIFDQWPLRLGREPIKLSGRRLARSAMPR